MTQITLVFLVLVCFAAINVAALVSSRRGTRRVHSLAFNCGLVGLCAIPLFMAAFVRMALETLFGTFASPEGVALIASAALLVAATIGSIVCTARLLRSV